ncbi:MFS transporter [candidate division KSB1 bacterium]|nr:MFS transporter [candidate division KSB1 bacterium]
MLIKEIVLKLFTFFATGKDKPPIKDPQLINKLFKQSRLSVMLAITLGYGFAYTCRLGLSVVKKPLIDGNIFTADQLGMIGSGIFYGYAFGKLINGFLADHANVKKYLATGIFMSALINLTMGWSTALWVWIILWGLNGWFQGFGAPSGIVSLSQWFSNSERGRYYGIWSTAHALGEGLTFIGSAALVGALGWRAGFWGPGILCILVAVAVYLSMRDRPQTMGLPSVAEWKNDFAVSQNAKSDQKKTVWQAQRTILKLPAIWVLGLSSATMYMTRYAINSWGFLYLQEAKGYSFVMAGSMLLLNTLAGIAGCLVFGYASDKLFKAKRPPVNLIFALLEVMALCVLFFGPEGKPILIIGAFLVYGFGLNGLVTSLGGLFAVDIAPKRAAGAALGFIGVFSYVAAAIQERISGHLIEKGTTIIDGVRHYDFSTPIIFWIGTSIVSLILAASLWRAETRD